MQLLDRSTEELLFVALTFLKKLSIFEPCKEQMAQADIVPKLVQCCSVFFCFFFSAPFGAASAYSLVVETTINY